jgi:hypothetical protein
MEAKKDIQGFAPKDGANRADLSRMLDWGETGTAALLSLSGVVWLYLMMIHAGPLWRDELSSLNLAQAASLRDFWDHLGDDSCPILWPATLRGWISLGLSGDLQIRALGLLIGLCMLAVPWWISCSVGQRVPILSASLLAFSPAFLFTVSSARAYGLGTVLLACTAGLTWRVVARDSPARLALLAAACMLAAHSLYTAAPFLFGILGSGILVLLHRRNWRGSAWILGIGLVTMGSMLVYLPVFAKTGDSFGLHQIPIDVQWIAVFAKRAVGTAGTVHVWGWGALAILGVFSALWSWIRRPTVPGKEGGVRLFFVLVLLVTPVAYALTLLRLKVHTQFWYYVPLMAVVSVAVDVLLGGRRCPPWVRVCRLTLAWILVVSAFPSVWQEVHTRRTNIDIAASRLLLDARPQDLIIVDPFYCGTSFERYYAGKTRWMTLPPIGNPRSGVYEDVKKAMMEKDPLREVLSSAEDTLRHGNRVWVVGQFILSDPQKLPPPPPPPPNGPMGWNHGPYSDYWSLRLGAFLLTHSGRIGRYPTNPGRPVNYHEDVALVAFLPPAESEKERVPALDP